MQEKQVAPLEQALCFSFYFLQTGYTAGVKNILRHAEFISASPGKTFSRIPGDLEINSG